MSHISTASSYAVMICLTLISTASVISLVSTATVNAIPDSEFTSKIGDIDRRLDGLRLVELPRQDPLEPRLDVAFQTPSQFAERHAKKVSMQAQESDENDDPWSPSSSSSSSSPSVALEVSVNDDGVIRATADVSSITGVESGTTNDTAGPSEISYIEKNADTPGTGDPFDLAETLETPMSFTTNQAPTNARDLYRNQYATMRHLHDHLSTMNTTSSTSFVGSSNEKEEPESSIGIEFSIQNTNTDHGNKPIIISGLGLYTTAGSMDEPIPCRVKVYTSFMATVESKEREFRLALDAEDVLCRGPEAETLVTSDFFLRQYLNSQKGQGGQQDGGNELDIPGRQLSEGDSINIHDLKDKGLDESPGRRIQNDKNENESSHPLVIPYQSILSLYIVVLPMDPNGDLIKIFSRPGSKHLAKYTSNESLTLYEGASIKKAYLVDAAANGGSDEDVPEIVKPTVFMGTLYYDILSKSDSAALEDYYTYLDEKVHDAILGGCYGSLVTGYLDSVGSYGLMFDVTSMVDGPESSSTIVIYGMDVYIRNEEGTTPIEVYVRINHDDDSHGEDIANRYTSYMETDGQTLEENWELVAEGAIQGRGAGIGTPIPPEMWIKTIVVEPGKSVGFYVTVLEAPHLRYRSSSLPEGNVYSTDGLLGVTVGRSWGEYPLKGDGSDVYFSQREFSGTFHYHAYDGVCKTDVPSSAPTVRETPNPVATPAATVAATAAPTPGKTIPVEYLCDLEKELTTTFQDGTGSYGVLFDIVAKRDLTVTGIDMFIDWNSGDNAEVLAYARKGSWFGFQNDPGEWPFLITNTTIHRPINFHNRTSNGPHIPYEKKKASAIIPDSDFVPLGLLEGETWSIYVCTNVADLRYTLGTSIGSLFTENDDLQILEGAGAADWPPFGGASAGIVGAKEYTFYAPRVFNGIVRYEYKAECPSAAPSGAAGVTPTPTAFPLLTTSAKYQFFVEHATDRSVTAISQDMEFAVNAVIDNFLKDVTNPLYQYSKNDDLIISSLIASVSSPTEIGYLCIPDPPNVCNLITVDVEATHRNTATTEDVKYALLYQAAILPSLINVAMYEVKYVGERAVASDSEITLNGVPDRLMGDVESKYFEEATLKFLNQQVSKSKYGSGDGALQILSVSVNGQEITSDPSFLESGRSTRRLKKANNVKVRVKGQHRPPPELDLGEFVESSINADREAFDRVLGERESSTPSQDGTIDSSDLGYFDEVQVAGARDMKDADTDDPLPPKFYTPVIVQKEEDDSLKDVLNIAAIVVGILISMLFAAFFLRPHRRSVIFGTKPDERQIMYTQQIDDGVENFMQNDSAHRRSFRGSFRKNRDRKTPLKSSMRSSTTGRTQGLNSSMISSTGFSVVSTQDSQRNIGQSSLPLALSNRHLMGGQGDLRNSIQSQGVPSSFRNSIQSQQSYNQAMPSSLRNSTLSQNSFQQSTQNSLRNSTRSQDSYNSAGQFSRSSNTSGQNNLRNSMQSQQSYRNAAQVSRSINQSTAYQ